MNILLVCSGNVSRSFFAEMLLENEIKTRGIRGVEVSSAGTHAYPGSPADPKMLEALLKKGIAVKDHESRQISKTHIDWADLIVVMEKHHAESIGNSWPDARDRVVMLGRYLLPGPQADDIADPFMKSPYHYRIAQSQITLAVQALAEKLLSEA